ncbi:hypothetical protein ENBRE01_1666, partial [Enteropsectra breve]
MLDSQLEPRHYEDVNREIQDFLNRRSVKAEELPYRKSAGNADILPLLESLNSTYNEINMYLRSGNADALKDVILKSDIKMSMVCETLLDTLQKTTEEKNHLQKDNNSLRKSKLETDEENARNKMKINKLEDDLDTKTKNLAELSRIIRDQKERMQEYKEDVAHAKAEQAAYKMKMEELENLRAKAMEKLLVFEKEMDIVHGILKEKEE